MLDVKKVSLFYGAAQILYDVDFQVEIGKVGCLLGRNGVGKTSLLKAITGRHSIKSGQIMWKGQDVSGLSSAARATLGISYVPQGREVFPQLSVKENMETGFVRLPRSERKIPDKIFELFPVLKDMMQRRGGDLSGGQQQQLAIARALIMQPELLILDEPTEGIQPSIIKDIGRAIEYLRDEGKMAILLVEQYFDFAQELADSYTVLDRGSVVVSGLKDTLTNDIRQHLTV